jgi:hypothetical protein
MQDDNPFPIFEDAEAWESARARLTHDWLNNSFGVALASLHNVLLGWVEAPHAAADVLQHVDQWKLQRDVAGQLVCSVGVLSPARCVDRPPLVALDSPSRAFLATLAEEEWWARRRPDRFAGTVAEMVVRVDRSCRRLGWVLRQECQGWFRAPGEGTRAVEEARVAVKELSEALTALGQCRWPS